MKASETASNTASSTESVSTPPVKSYRSAKYQKVRDGSKRPVRGLWQRNGRFVARIAVEGTGSETGSKKVRWVVLGSDADPVTTVPQAVKALRKLQDARENDALPVLQQTPKFADFVSEYSAEVDRLQILAQRPGNSNKPRRPATVEKERAALDRWTEHLGETRLNKISDRFIKTYIRKRQDAGISNRTIALDIIALRSLLKLALEKGHVKSLPSAARKDLKWKPPKRELFAGADIERICDAGFKPVFRNGRVIEDPESAGQPLKNAQQFSDYVRLMAYSGARRDEAIRLKWEDVKWERKQVEIGSDGLAKNHQSRFVDFNPKLEQHLKEMFARRAPDSEFLFPSPQRGDRDENAKTFRESLYLARQAAELPNFSFHDCRHFFISFCVMSLIDYMTIAEWVGHQDGGILIGKVYGHLADEHKKQMANKLVFTPGVVNDAAVKNHG